MSGRRSSCFETLRLSDALTPSLKKISISIYLLLAAAVVCWLLALHPFITYPLSLLLIRQRVRSAPVGAGVQVKRPLMTMCTCAYNEAGIIEEKIENLLALKQRYSNLEILLYIDGASDGTTEIARRYEGRISLHASSTRHGKTHGMNFLAQQAEGDLLVFSDANVMLDAEAADRLVAHFAEPTIGCVCGNLIYTNSSASITAATGSLYWRLEQFIKRRESLHGSVMGADGSIFAVRRSLHVAPPDDIIDDMFVSFSVLCAGFLAIQVDDVRAYEESVTAAPEEFRRKVRIACQAFNVHRLIWPQVRATFGALQLYMYISHKLLRWFSVYLLAGGGLLFCISLVRLGYSELTALILISCCAAQYVGMHWQVPLLSSVTDVLLSLLGAGIGVYRSFRGERFQTWQPATSIRR